jgi:hypothetical protein
MQQPYGGTFKVAHYLLSWLVLIFVVAGSMPLAHVDEMTGDRSGGGHGR